MIDRTEALTAAPAEISHVSPLPIDHAADEVAPEPLSTILDQIANTWPAERITVGDLMAAFGPRGYGLLLFVFALPNMIPNPFPGLSSLLGIPLLLLAWQMARGQAVATLPNAIATRSISVEQLRTIARRAGPWIAKVERWLKPRPGWLTTIKAERLIGIVALILSIPILLPGPGTNGPPSWAIGLMAIGVLQRDRIVVLSGLLFGIVALALGTAGLIAAWWITMQLIDFVF